MTTNEIFFISKSIFKLMESTQIYDELTQWALMPPGTTPTVWTKKNVELIY